MAVSVLEIFKVGIGPSSSHTVGPMRAACMFTLALAEQGVMTSVTRVLSEMFGSLGATGKGHGTDSAVLLGLSGHEPDTVDVDQVPAILEGIRGSSVGADSKLSHRGCGQKLGLVMQLAPGAADARRDCESPVNS